MAQDTKQQPQIRTILVTPKEAARIMNMGGGVPVVSPRKAAVTSWQTTAGTATETDLLSTLSAAGKGLFTLTAKLNSGTIKHKDYNKEPLLFLFYDVGYSLCDHSFGL